jgi:hypothetical protein
MRNKVIIVVQIAAWAAFLCSPFILTPKSPIDSEFSSPHFNYLFFICNNLFLITYYYLNYYYFIPNFFIPRKYVRFLLITLGCMAFIVFASNLFQAHISPSAFQSHLQGLSGYPPRRQPGGAMRLMPPIVLFLLIFLTSLGIRITSQWKKVEQEKTNVELLYLKAQINPHFLFNTLNTIYAMAIKKSDTDTANAVVMLSDMMRFVITETHNEYVPLEKKMAYINNYLELQKLRAGKNMKLVYRVEGEPIGKKIAPMTLMPFIENAFKHGVTAEKDFFILIFIRISENLLVLDVTNSKHKEKPDGTKDDTKLGIENTLKRIALIYPSKYTIETHEDDMEYNVKLKILIG